MIKETTIPVARKVISALNGARTALHKELQKVGNGEHATFSSRSGGR